MGAGASIDDGSETVAKSRAIELAGDAFDESLFAAAASPFDYVLVSEWNAFVSSASEWPAPSDAQQSDDAARKAERVAEASALAASMHEHLALVGPEPGQHVSGVGLDGGLADRAAAFLAMDQGGRDAQVNFVRETLVERERIRKRVARARAKEAAVDYSKSLSGTAADSKAEKEFAALMKETGGKAELPDDEFAHLLRVITEKDAPETYEALRAAGRWLRVEVIHGDGLPGVGWIHSLTCEESFTRPFDYVEETAADGGPKVDPFAGLASCDMEDIIERIESIIAGDAEAGREAKTPLLIDTSPDRKMATFFKYKGVLVELEQIGWSRKRQADEKVSGAKVMEEARRRAVVCMRHGKTLVLDVGTMGQGCMLKEVWCKETGLDVRVFEEGGKKLVGGKPQPFCKKMWKDGEKVSGEIIIDAEFRVVVLTSWPPADALRELEDPLPLQHLTPVVVVFGRK